MFTVPSARTVPTGASTGSLQVSDVSPLRTAALPLILTVALPVMMVPLLLGGLTKVPPMGTWGGVLVQVLPTTAAGILMMFTFELSDPSMMPLKRRGVGTGELGPGG